MTDRQNTILNNILEAVGQTPMIRLNRVPQMHGIQCEVVAKCEFLNPGGSVKDRIGVRMVSDAEKQGRIKPGMTLVEATSGNTGIGLSMSAAVKGYGMVITMPLKMSHEKAVTLDALGAQVIRTPTSVAFDHPDSLISVAKRLVKEKGYVLLDQYGNPSNNEAHLVTGEEIYNQCGGKVDMVVVTAGTGGTMTGIATYLKAKLPNVKIVCVDPIGSILADPANPPVNAKPYQVEGIGYDFVPAVCHRQLVDQWVKSEDRPSFDLARQLHRHEGMLVGGSCGSAMWGVVQAAKELRPDQRCVVIFSDSIRNYMSKFPDKNWRIEYGLDEGPVTRPTYTMLEKENAELKEKLKRLEGKPASKM